ncbi:hypothetical protein EJ04DRAFT_507468 [Polyplosphaeria fusca]|uniref:Uncharacterized protein n=1 Tax=Polyplosphaeria fusca TaxID=682080 RepID=A0A9P4V8W5_9PLEO|nr:hypothetical protein EJ04DRAFT_507468 [Polyplosphaeria fusca]
MNVCLGGTEGLSNDGLSVLPRRLSSAVPHGPHSLLCYIHRVEKRGTQDRAPVLSECAGTGQYLQNGARLFFLLPPRLVRRPSRVLSMPMPCTSLARPLAFRTIEFFLSAGLVPSTRLCARARSGLTTASSRCVIRSASPRPLCALSRTRRV